MSESNVTALPRLGQEPVDVSTPDEADERLWGVTSLLNALSKGGLTYWLEERCAATAVDRLEDVQRRLVHEGRESAIKYVMDHRDDGQGLLSAADMGSIFHGLVQQYALDRVRPVPPRTHRMRGRQHAIKSSDRMLIGAMVDQWERFVDEYAPSFEAAEVAVFAPTYGYAGTLDAIVTIDGRRLVLDYKTSRETYTKQGKLRGPYPEVALQLAAYRHAELAAVWRARRYEHQRRRYYLLNEAERAMAVPVPEVDGGIAVYVTPETYAVHPVKCGPEVFKTFLHVSQVARWQFLTGRHAVGAPMIPPHPRQPMSDPFEGLPKF